MLITVLGILAATSARAGELVVIVNPANKTVALTQRQLVNLYMGRTQHYPNGKFALPLDQAPDSQARQTFYRTLVGKSVAEVNAYWAKLLFTGRASPPRSLTDAEAVLQVVRENLDAIGYIDSRDLDDSVKVVGRVD
jgi:ABC-type phosphate transport system substrate-binding protein